MFHDVLSGSRTALKSDFAAVLEDRGMAMPDQRLSYHIRLAEYSGQLCSGDLQPLKKSYALVEKKLPSAGTVLREESLAFLARKYFRSHGPATIEDFAWWSGIGLNDCRLGVSLLGDELVQERWKGLVLFFHRDGRIRGFRRGCVHLLPPYDEYLIGYKSRHVALHPDHTHRAHNNSGIFWPVILLDGEVAGNWSAASGKISVNLFRPDAVLDEDALQKQIARFKRADDK